MELVLGGVAVVLIVVGLLWWTRRRGNPGERGTDAYAHKNIARANAVPRSETPDGGGGISGP